MRRAVHLCGVQVALLAFVTMCFWATASGDAPATQPAATQPAKSLKINLDSATAVAVPEVTDDLKPVSFTTPDGKEGWAIRLPGNRPIATPAYADSG